MDKNTLSEYGWVIVVIILLALLLAFIPVLGGILDIGTNKYVSTYFDNDGEAEANKLDAPVLLTVGQNLQISHASKLAKEYEIAINSVSRGVVTAIHPTTLYDLSRFAGERIEISVIAKAPGYEDSEPSKTFYPLSTVATKQLKTPEIYRISQDDALGIIKGSVETQKYKITIDNGQTEIIDASNDGETLYDMSSLLPGYHTISVVAAAEGWKDSAPALDSFTKGSDTPSIPKEDFSETLIPIGATCEYFVALEITKDADGLDHATIFKNQPFEFSGSPDAEIQCPACGKTHRQGSDGIMKNFDASPFVNVEYVSYSGSAPYCDLDGDGDTDAHDAAVAGQYLTGWGDNIESPYDESTIKDILGSLHDDTLASTEDAVKLAQYLEQTGGDVAVDGFEETYYYTYLVDATIHDGVVNVGDNLFALCSLLQNVSLPSSITSIGNASFASCSALKSIALPENLETIGERAFAACSLLTDMPLKSKVIRIEQYAFTECVSLQTVVIPKNVEYIGSRIFKGCTSIKSLTVPFIGSKADDPQILGYLFDPVEWYTTYLSGTQVRRTRNSNKNVPGKLQEVILTNCEVLAGSAFSGCSNLTRIVLPNNLTKIGDLSFRMCEKLANINIPNGVTSIGEQAFIGCKNLVGVTIGNDVTDIGKGAFKNCSSLTSIMIPNGVTSIKYETFYGCKNLTNITLPEGVTSIGNYAFAGCSGCTQITLPSTLTNIGCCAFYVYPNLEAIFFNGTKSQWSNVSRTDWDFFEHWIDEGFEIQCTDGEIWEGYPDFEYPEYPEY